MNLIKSLLHRAVPMTEEDRVINEVKTGNCQPFIDYFRNNDVPFKDYCHRRKSSPTNRVVYEDDIYSYVYIDGVWIDCMEIPLPYEVRKKLFSEMENAVMGNVYGTVAYEEKHFGRKEVA
jgi:hypothetical protein